MVELAKVGELLPYVEGTYRFKDRELRERFPEGLHIKAGVGTAALLALIMLAVLDKLGTANGARVLLGLREDVRGLDLFPPYDIARVWVGDKKADITEAKEELAFGSFGVIGLAIEAVLDALEKG